MAEFKLTPELIKKAKGAKSTLELITIAKAEGIKISTEEAKAAFAQINPKTGELDDVELDNVSGGGCNDGTTPTDSCGYYEAYTSNAVDGGKNICYYCKWWDRESYEPSFKNKPECLNPQNS